MWFTCQHRFIYINRYLDLSILIGNNININCQYNFNHLLKQIIGQNYRNYLYQLFLLGDNNYYY